MNFPSTVRRTSGDISEEALVLSGGALGNITSVGRALWEQSSVGLLSEAFDSAFWVACRRKGAVTTAPATSPWPSLSGVIFLAIRYRRVRGCQNATVRCDFFEALARYSDCSKGCGSFSSAATGKSFGQFGKGQHFSEM